ncbi:scavenger receptor cysteine-rich domain-containing group B protein isoform X1 [Salmo trutta]|uniref:scavenger receptor cysteine-rich domain-containing group B protein isoform X1 n=1 Tax=Salmo trutta TaxID=8032 RepID=UPI00112FF2E1|nr:scavenger receptor cysteine-rich domain-containing group B protein-like isoform X1 [Salmo trutta]
MRGQRVADCVRRPCGGWTVVVWLLLSLLGSLLLVGISGILQIGEYMTKISRRAISTNSTTTMTAMKTTHSQVRLVNGRNRCEGRVEVWHNGTWGTVCDDDWDMVDANVVCRQLDCGLAMVVGSISEYGQGSGPVLLDNVDCKGGETDLGQCGSLGWGIHNCYHYEDVSVTCKDTSVLESRGMGEPTTPSRRNSGLRDGTIRLVGGLDYCQGRVEVYYRGSWGTVCDDDWGMRDAGVVCQQIYCGHAVSSTTNAYFGYGTGLILLDNVNCNGYENQLSKCYSLGWGIHNCGHHEDAGVICSGSGSTTVPPMNTDTMGMGRGVLQTASTAVTDQTELVTEATTAVTTIAMTTRERPTIRVVNGNSSCQGRVEVFHNNQWGTVCDDDWDLPNAQVVCRHLGCGPAISAKVLAYFGYGSGPILLDNVDCRGSEGELAACFHLGWGQHNCGHHEDAGVICTPFQLVAPGNDFGMTERTPTTRPPSEGLARLVGGQHRCEGRVEMFSGAEWGTVCDDAWDMPDAQVVCRQLGCGEAAAARGEAFFGPGSGTILLDNLKCSGSEASLQQCSHISWEVHNCDHSEDAGVTCSLS